MSWLKGSDTAINHPAVLAPLAWDPQPEWPVTDGLLSVLLHGMVNLCATHSAGMDTDYVVEDATVAAHVRDPRWRMLAQLAARAGYWERLADDTGWLLIDDDLLFHIRLKAEKEWERARKADAANPAWTVPVRLRDGDGCRYCGDIVNWTDRTGGRGGTYDHRQPGKPAKTIEDLVVACRACNSSRRDDPDALPLLPPPAEPHYGASTVAFLANKNVTVALSTTAPRPRPVRDTATSDPAPSGTTHPTATLPTAGPRSTTQRPGTQPDNATPSTQDNRDGAAPRRPHRAPRPVMPTDTAHHQHKPASTDPAASQATEAGRAGSGRDGTGGQAEPPTKAEPNRKARRPRGRRGRQHKPRTQ